MAAAVNVNEDDDDLERRRRPTSTCPDCGHPGCVDPNQRMRLHRGAPRYDAQEMIRFNCSCGAVWIVESRQAHQMGDWLKRVGLYRLLSPPARKGLVAPPPPYPAIKPYESEYDAAARRGKAARAANARAHIKRKRPPPEGDGR